VTAATAALPTAAIVDIGSNSVRLFLCSGWGPDGPEGERSTVITALRRGAAADGTVSGDALERLEVCLRDYAVQIEAFSPARIVPVATSATRDAPNRGDVVRVVERCLGVSPLILTGEEEAAFAFAGARLAVAEGSPVTVVDIGGGSTEIVYGTGPRPDGATSLQVGAVRCTESHLVSDPPSVDQLDALAQHVASQVRPVAQALPVDVALVGVAGTITTVAAVLLGEYDPERVHNFSLSRADLAATTTRMAAMSLAERRTVAGLHPDRAAVIVAGAVILGVVMDEIGADRMKVSERDLLDGVAAFALGHDGNID
jgi:exopolyphosphatase / guanosine-5'-triphosphate,3'-diphosphate pyrophosphatase